MTFRHQTYYVTISFLYFWSVVILENFKYMTLTKETWARIRNV